MFLSVMVIINNKPTTPFTDGFPRLVLKTNLLSAYADMAPTSVYVTRLRSLSPTDKLSVEMFTGRLGASFRFDGLAFLPARRPCLLQEVPPPICPPQHVPIKRPS